MVLNSQEFVKKGLLLIAFTVFIAGCGGSNGSDSSSTIDSASTSTSTVEYVAIDGYLSGAQVYVDRNLDHQGSSDEYVTDTGEDGKFEIVNEDTAYPIIIKVIAGVTEDSDVAGALTESRELIAEAGQTTITPFSTLAVANDMTMSELASSLSLDESKISGDFIESGDTDIHAIARSIYQLLEENIVSEESYASVRLVQSQALASYVSNNSDTDWTDVILKLDENNNVTVSTDDAEDTVFDWSTAEVQWEHKEFGTGADQNGISDDFHPCTARKWTDDIIIVTNCQANSFMTLSASTGETLNTFSVGDYNQYWFIDDTALTIGTGDDAVHYNHQFELLSDYTPTDKVRLTGDNYYVINNTDNTEIDTLVSTYGTNGSANSDTWEADGLAFRAYDPDTGMLYEVTPDGTLTSTQYETEFEIESEVAPIHNGLSSNGVIDFDAVAAGDNLFTTYLSDGTFLVRVDSDYTSSNYGYVSVDYHYLYRNGKVTYIGKFYDGDWYMGLDNSTVSWYASINSNDYTERPHQFKQFDLKSGELVGEWEKSFDEFEPVLYKQYHSSVGVVSISDRYSSVSLIK